MGLDIYFHLYKKVRERNAGETFPKYYNALVKANDKATAKEAKQAIKDGIAKLKKAENFSLELAEFNSAMAVYFPYEFERKDLIDAKSVEDVEKWAGDIKWDWFYKPSDAYFRKVNCIYRYFADRLEDEVCEVYKSDITEIISRATRILAERDNALAEELLPTQSGFFFGSTDYDNWYFGDVEDCKRQMEKLLSMYDEDTDVVFFIMSW